MHPWIRKVIKRMTSLPNTWNSLPVIDRDTFPTPGYDAEYQDFPPLRNNAWAYSNEDLPGYQAITPRQDPGDLAGYNEMAIDDGGASTSRKTSRRYGPYRRTPVFQQYVNFHDRLATYKKWPPGNVHKAKDLTTAGFFYSGKADSITCFHCCGTLSHLLPQVNIRAEHVKFFPDCLFAQLVAPPLSPKKKAGSSTKNDSSPASAATEEQDDDYKVICSICLLNEANMACVPCGHLTCGLCLHAVRRCALCRHKIISAMKIFL